MNWLVWLLTFGLIGAPTAALMLDRIRGYPATKFIKTQGLPALIALVLLLIYMYVSRDPILNLLVWGTVGGLLGTVALDVVRLLGVKRGAFPMDMPQMFGSMALGSAPYLPKHVMANMVAMLAKMPDEARREMMEPRISAIANMPASERRMFLGMMQNGLMKLSQSERDPVVKTQIGIISSLPPNNRIALMETMDQLMAGGILTSPPPNPVPAFRAGLMPKFSMRIFRRLVESAVPMAAKEKGVTWNQVLFTGYLWHFINGATYGVAYTLLFGHGSWLLAFAWGTFVWLVMMAGMPKMMPMVQLPYPRFMIVPLLAHWAMMVPIGFFALSFVIPGAANNSLFGSIFNL